MRAMSSSSSKGFGEEVVCAGIKRFNFLVCAALHGKYHNGRTGTIMRI
jgi:hypothetical protein